MANKTLTILTCTKITPLICHNTIMWTSHYSLAMKIILCVWQVVMDKAVYVPSSNYTTMYRSHHTYVLWGFMLMYYTVHINHSSQLKLIFTVSTYAALTHWIQYTIGKY